MIKKTISSLMAASLFFNINIAVVGRTLALAPIASILIAEDNAYADNQTKVKIDRTNKSKGIAIFLSLFLGLHHFYLKNNKTAVTYIVLTILFGIGQILSLIDFFVLIFMTDQEWEVYLRSDRALLWW